MTLLEHLPVIVQQYTNPRTLKSWGTFAGMLKRAEAATGTVAYTDINTEGLQILVNALFAEGLAVNTVGLFISKMKALIQSAARHGHRINTTIHIFQADKEESHAIYLTQDEIKLIAGALLPSRLQLARDRFILGCVTGLRHSDYIRLGREHVAGDCFSILTEKRKQRVVIPIHKLAAKIFRKYNGNPPPLKGDLIEFNGKLSDIGRLSGLTQIEHYERSINKQVMKMSSPRYRLITSHTARRSFATNAYLSKIETARIMLITGHKTEESFFKYIRINKAENAAELSNHPFFN